VVQDPYQGSEDNINNVRRENSKHFRNKKKEYLKATIEELETKGKLKNIGDPYRASKIVRRVTSLELI